MNLPALNLVLKQALLISILLQILLTFASAQWFNGRLQGRSRSRFTRARVSSSSSDRRPKRGYMMNMVCKRFPYMDYCKREFVPSAPRTIGWVTSPPDRTLRKPPPFSMSGTIRRIENSSPLDSHDALLHGGHNFCTANGAKFRSYCVKREPESLGFGNIQFCVEYSSSCKSKSNPKDKLYAKSSGGIVSHKIGQFCNNQNLKRFAEKVCFMDPKVITALNAYDKCIVYLKYC